MAISNRIEYITTAEQPLETLVNPDRRTMRSTTRLRQLIEAPELLVMPGCYDVISGKIVEESGFDAAQVSGANLIACHYGAPDYGMVSMREMAEQSGRIARALSIPVMADADTGFGNAVNAFLTVREFERVGVAGMNLEDQVEPKRCGHLDGKEVLPFHEAVGKVRAAADARADPDFVINARTDALGPLGYDEAVRRGNAFLEAGATMVFVESVNSIELMERLVRDIAGPVAVNLVEGGKSPQDATFQRLQDIGIARVSLPSTAMQAQIAALRQVFAKVRKHGGINGYSDMLCGFGISQRMVGFETVKELEQKYLAENR